MSQELWLILLLAASLLATGYLAYRIHRGSSARLEDERRRVRHLEELHLATTEVLAAAIDAKDQKAPHHLRRVQAYAEGVARGLGMPEHEIEGLKTAALLYDIGKLAVPDHILAKTGPLTPEEYAKVRIHPRVAADILSSVPFPYPVAQLILSHHERWDGRGYPSGLRGTQIPLGARILCVADYFEALTSDRPYHGAMSLEASIALILHNSNHAFDPRVVDTFVRMLPELRAQLDRQGHLHKPSSDVSHGANAASTRGRTAPKPSVFEQIALAHREIYALYQIAQTMGTGLGVSDTMALIAPKLAHLIQFSACALFLRTESTDTLQCRFATGTDADVIERLSLRKGNGLTGWIARNREDLMQRGLTTDPNPDTTTLLQSALVSPLLSGDRFIGMLAVYHTEPNFYGDDHRRLLDRVCVQAASVVHNAMIFEQTQEDSLTDPLTALPNARSMRSYLTRELARSRRARSEVAMVVIDLNGFKAINDQYGHHTGDRALREVANVLRATIRPYDVCARYAGDEFVVVLPDCNRAEAEDKRAELQQAVESLRFEGGPDDRVPLSISAGTAVFPHDGSDYDSLLTEADRNMYMDKSRRRHGAGTDAVDSTPPSPIGRARRSAEKLQLPH